MPRRFALTLAVLALVSTAPASEATARQPGPDPVQIISSRLRWGMSEQQAEAAGARYFAHFLAANGPVLGFPQVDIAGVGLEVWLQFDQRPKLSGDEGKHNIPETGLNEVRLVKHGECDEAGYTKLKRYLSSQYRVYRPESITGETAAKNREISYETANHSVIVLESICNIRSETYKSLLLHFMTPVSN